MIRWIFIFLGATTAMASDFGRSHIKKMRWQDLEVVWLADDRFPTYTIKAYFADGALSDGPDKGMTNAMFDLLPAGTRRFNQKQIADNLEFYGVGLDSTISHEQSTFSISGLVKDIIPVMKKVCHVFADATYPKQEINNYKRLAKSGFKSLVNSHDELASRAFRELSMRQTPYAMPPGGKLKHVGRINQEKLKRKLRYFNTKVKKRLYINGPSGVLQIKDIILKECGWTGEGTFVRKVSKSKSRKTISTSGPNIYLITVPKANQAQVYIGRYLNKGEFEKPELLILLSSFLTNGKLSILFGELRVKYGLVYHVSAFAAGQKDYGRAAISTATKNTSVVRLLQVTKEALEKVGSNDFPKEQFSIAKAGIIGRYPFRFESGDTYLAQLLFLDHVQRNYNELFQFQQRTAALTSQDVAQAAKDIFAWNKQTIVILGPASLEKDIKALGKVRTLDYKKFL